jgi:hypothetical protein
MIDALERMLITCPASRIVIAHFGPVRYPELHSRFSPELLHQLLHKYANLYFDSSTGKPGRRYSCTNKIDTVIWEDGIIGSQKRTLKPEYKSMLAEFSNRFVTGLDYNGGNIRKSQKPSSDNLSRRTNTIRKIIQDLPEEAQHNIAYRNACVVSSDTGKVELEEYSRSYQYGSNGSDSTDLSYVSPVVL